MHNGFLMRLVVADEVWIELKFRVDGLGIVPEASESCLLSKR